MLIQRIEEEFKVAMKSRDVIKLETLRMVKAAVRNFLIEKKKDQIDDLELLSLIQKQVKLRNDSIESFQKAGRKDLLDKESREKELLEAYLPKPLTPKELEEVVAKAIQKTGAKGKADMGKVMKEALLLAEGRANGKQVSETAGRLLP